MHVQRIAFCDSAGSYLCCKLGFDCQVTALQSICLSNRGQFVFGYWGQTNILNECKVTTGVDCMWGSAIYLMTTGMSKSQARIVFRRCRPGNPVPVVSWSSRRPAKKKIGTFRTGSQKTKFITVSTDDMGGSTTLKSLKHQKASEKKITFVLPYLGNFFRVIGRCKLLKFKFPRNWDSQSAKWFCKNSQM